MLDFPTTVGLVLMLLGFVGVFLPLVPGVPVMLLGAYAYSYLTGWDRLTLPWLLLMTLLTVGSIAFDFIAAAWLARRMGASGRASLAAVLGTLAGVIWMGAWGALLGGMGGAVLGELSLGSSWQRALRSGTGAFLGFLLTLAADVVVALVLLSIYLSVAL